MSVELPTLIRLKKGCKRGCFCVVEKGCNLGCYF